jgi:hypothetical protein
MCNMVCLYRTLERVYNMRLADDIIETAGPVFEG